MSKNPKSGKGASRPKKKAPAADRSVGVDHNGLAKLSDDQRKALLLQACRQIEGEQAKIATHTANVRNIRKTAKADGISPAELNYALFLRKCEPEQAVAEFRMHAKVAQWLAHPVGKQADLFGGEEDRTPAVDKAYEEGKIMGLEGLDAPIIASHDPVGQSRYRGWQDGQAVLAKGIRTVAESEPGHVRVLGADEVETDDDDEDEANLAAMDLNGDAPARVN